MNRRIVIAAAAMILGAFSLPARAGEIPWDRIDGAEGLRGIFREVAAEVLGEARCYGTCDGTIASCLAADPDDPFARRLAAFVVRRVRADQDPEDILREIEDRRLSAFPEKTYEPDLEGLVVSGSRDAPLQVVVYADFDCPYCRATLTALRKYVGAHPDRIAFYLKNFPLKTHERAVPAALALLAAGRQGKLWEMHDLLFEKEDDLSEERLGECASLLGLDAARFAADRSDPALLARLRAEKMEGLRFGVKKTPGILVNGKFYRGIRIWEELRDRIEEELDLIGLPK